MTKVKIPKRIGAVKIPKKLRKKANKVLKAASGDALGAIAGAALSGATRPRTSASCTREIQVDCAEIETVIDTVRSAALSGLHAFLEGLEQGLREQDEEAPGDEAPAQP
jgi:hypothetical protein